MASYLLDRRLALGKKQKDVAQYVGVSEATVSRWESGDIANMRRDKIKKYAEILETSTDFIMNGYRANPDAQGSPPDEDDELAHLLEDLRERPETRVLLEASRGMTKEQIEVVADFVRRIRGGDFNGN